MASCLYLLLSVIAASNFTFTISFITGIIIIKVQINENGTNHFDGT